MQRAIIISTTIMCMALLTMVTVHTQAQAPPDQSQVQAAQRSTNAEGKSDAFLPLVQTGNLKADRIEPKTIQLPIEVLGPDGYTQSVSVNLDNADKVDQLWLRVHRPGYTDGGGDKAGVRVNDGAWINLNNDTVTVIGPEKSYGGIGGGFYTVRMSVPITGLKNGANTLTFRFNGTDGSTSGYRIIGLNFLRDGDFVLPDSAFEQEQVADWQPPLNNPTDVAEGKRLWEEAQLVESPLAPNRAIRARCASCHAQDGRDLKYFNYSNWSIIARSQFHGLSEKEGEQIASYIRSLEVPNPGRPWNPPYQPGPGLDDRPVQMWAAGAGINAVLERDADMLPYLFPDGTTPEAIRQVADTKGTLNIREMPVAMQFPDWNAWLPEVHPLDLWGDMFVEGIGEHSPQQAYLQVRQEFDEKGVEQLLEQPDGFMYLTRQINAKSRGFLAEGRVDSSLGGSHWRSLDSIALKHVIQNRRSGVSERTAREQAKFNIARWSATKQWEIMHEYNLEDKSPQILPVGESRAWPTDGQSVHPLAPHIVADDIQAFEDQPLVVGKYQSSVWYQLQMTINSGQRQEVNVQPQDWPYQFLHIRALSDVSDVEHPLRYIQSMIKGYQNRDNGVGPTLDGWQLRVTHPWWLYSTPYGDTSVMDELNTYEDGLRERVVSSMLREFLEVTTAIPEDEWTRCGHNIKNISTWYCIESPTYRPTNVPDGQGRIFEIPANWHADNFYRVIPRLRENGVNPDVLDDLIDWCEKMWPGGKQQWDSLRE